MKLYVLVRNDLTPEQKAVQACHAVAEFVSKHHADPQVQEWQVNHKTMVLLSVENERELLEWAEKLDCSLFYEPDIPAHTALAALPEDGKVFRDLSLLKMDLTEGIACGKM